MLGTNKSKKYPKYRSLKNEPIFIVYEKKKVHRTLRHTFVILLANIDKLFHNPPLDIPSIIIKVNPDFEQLSGIRFKWSGVMFRFDLL